MKYYYPIIFFPDKTASGKEIFGAVVPDLQGCLTQCEDLFNAMYWTADAMGTWLDGLDEKDYPKPSKPSELDLSEYPEGTIVNLIEFDPEKYFHTVKYAAKKAGLDIKKTAKLLGAPYSTVRNWFIGTHQPPPWIERLIVKKFKMPFSLPNPPQRGIFYLTSPPKKSPFMMSHQATVRIAPITCRA